MAHWLNRLERRFGRFGIPNLILYIVAGRGLAYLLARTNPEFPYYLVLDPDAVRHGQVWRLFTYVFTPPGGNIFFAMIELYFTYIIGNALETVWGSFRFTLYYMIGALATAAVALLVPGAWVTPIYLNLSLFLAFATLFPEFTVLLFFILPVKVKYLGWISAGYLTLLFWTSPLSEKLFILTALTNYLLFFWPEIREWTSGKLRSTRTRPSLTPTGSQSTPIHRCTVCHTTEANGPYLEFRICTCARCGEGKEFCMEHLQEHRSHAA